MSDLNKDQEDKVNELLKSLGVSLSDAEKAMPKFKKIISEVGDSFTDIESSIKRLNRDIEKNTQTLGNMTLNMLKSGKAIKDLSWEYDHLNDKIEELNEQMSLAAGAEREKIKQQITELALTREQLSVVLKVNAGFKSLEAGLGKFGAGLVSVAGVAFSGLTKFASGLQDGASAFSAVGGLMEGTVDVLNTGAHTLGSTMQAAGSAMSVLPGNLKWVGLGLQVFGVSINGVSDALAALAKFAIGYMTKEIEKVVQAFDKATAAGAMYADGMKGLEDSAHAAGLTVKQFSEALQKNSSVLAESGLSVAEAGKKIGNVLGAGNGGLSTKLLKLGYTYEEHTALVAETMAQMRQSGKILTSSDPVIAEQTEKYATNLRVIAAITGKDAKEKEAAAKEAARSLRMQQILDEMDPTAAAGIERAMANMTKLQLKNFTDMMVFGTVINKEGAIAVGNSQGLSNELNESVKLAKEGKLDEISLRQLQSQYHDQITKDLLKGDASVGIAIAGAAKMGKTTDALAAVMAEELQSRKLLTKQAMEAGEKAANAQKNTNDDLTNSVVIASEQMQDLAVGIENDVLPRLSKFSVYANQYLNQVRTAMQKFEDLNGEGKPETFVDSLKRGFLEYGGAGAVAGGLVGGAVTAPVGGIPGAVVGAGLGGISAGIGGAILEGYRNIKQPVAAAGGGNTAGAGASNAPGHWNRALSYVPGGVSPKIPAGLNTNGDEGDAQISPALQSKLAGLAAAFPGATITAMHDSYHSGWGSKHNSGQAIDFVIPDYNAKKHSQDPKDLQKSEAIIKNLKGMGFTKVLDEYINPSEHSTGQHIHAELKDGGIVTPTDGGRNIKVAEGGQAEGVFPYDKNKPFPMHLDDSQFKQLVNLLSGQTRTNQKILTAVS
jgi:archaellum component FlaC